MTLNIGEANAAMTLIRHVLEHGEPEKIDGRMKDSLIVLQNGAYRTLGAGVTQRELVAALFPVVGTLDG